MKIVATKRYRGLLAALCVLAGLGGVSVAASAETISADFNGDGKTDTATLNSTYGTISIARGGGGTTSYNTSAGWLSVSTAETNGVAGQEIVITFASGYNAVVDDRARTTCSDIVDPVGAGRVVMFADVNGTAGVEVAFIYDNGIVMVVDDRARARRSYVVDPIGGGRVVSVSDLNGSSGNEIAFIYDNGIVSVIDDRAKARRDYVVDPIGSNTRYVKVAEFNGTAGNEIMFSYSNGYSEVVDDRLRTMRTYVHPTNGSAPTYANMDGVAGLEAVFTYAYGKVWLSDRARSVTYH